MNVINTNNAPAAIGPYSQAYEACGLVITSGQLPVDPATGAMPEGIAAQAEWSCKNVGRHPGRRRHRLRQGHQDHLPSWRTSAISPLSMRCTPSISPPSPPGAVWP